MRYHFYTSLHEAETAAMWIHIALNYPIAMPEEIRKNGVKIITFKDGWGIAETPISVKILGVSKLQEVEIPAPPKVEEVKSTKSLIPLGICLLVIISLFLIIRGLT